MRHGVPPGLLCAPQPEALEPPATVGEELVHVLNKEMNLVLTLVTVVVFYTVQLAMARPLYERTRLHECTNARGYMFEYKIVQISYGTSSQQRLCSHAGDCYYGGP